MVMNEKNISLFYCRIEIHYLSELRCALGGCVFVCVCVQHGFCFQIFSEKGQPHAMKKNNDFPLN